MVDEDTQNIKTAKCSKKYFEHNSTKEDTMKKIDETTEENNAEQQDRIKIEEEFRVFRTKDRKELEADNEYEGDFFFDIFSVLILI